MSIIDYEKNSNPPFTSLAVLAKEIAEGKYVAWSIYNIANEYISDISNSQSEIADKIAKGEISVLTLSYDSDQSWYGGPNSGGYVGWVSRMELEFKDGVAYCHKHARVHVNASSFRVNEDDEEDVLLEHDQTFWSLEEFSVETFKHLRDQIRDRLNKLNPNVENLIRLHRIDDVI